LEDHEFSERIVAMTDTLYRVCYAQLRNEHDREDAVQECLCKAWQNREKLRDGRYLQTWVCRILINECHNIQRRNSRLSESGLDGRTDSAQNLPPPPDAIPELHDALLRLPDEQRMPIVLHYLAGFSIGEIAQILEVPAGTVKSRMHHARASLATALQDEPPSSGPEPRASMRALPIV
jgi:RNA polymerase sigma-70 factor (ECF subfamily)